MKRRLLCVLGAALLLMAALYAGNEGGFIIVKLKEGKSIRQVNTEHGTSTVRQIPKTRIYLIRIEDNADRVLKKIKRDPNVEKAEENLRFRLNSPRFSLSVTPRLVDDMVSMLDGQTTTSFNGATVLKAYAEQPALRVIRADQVRSLSTGAGTRVGYIDTGVDPNHQALRPWLEPGADLVYSKTSSEFYGLSDDMVSMLDDDMVSMLDKRFMFFLNRNAVSILASAAGYSGIPSAFGHGTLVAGLIHVVAPDARIVPIKAFDAYGNTTVFTLIESVYKAIELNVDALNMSFSTSDDSALFHESIDAARAEGIAVVSAAGNDAREGRDIYPAGYPGVYGVAATDLNDRLTSFSNYGSTVSITAPGAFVVSTVPGGRYALAWGTSFSAPIVAGAIALRASWQPHGQSDAPIVINTADPIDAWNPGFERKLGRGRLNVRAALRAAK